MLIASIFSLPRTPGSDITGIRWARLTDGTLEVYYPTAAGIHRGTVAIVAGRHVEWLSGTPSHTAWEPVTFALEADLAEELAGRTPQYRLDERYRLAAPSLPGPLDMVIARWRGEQARRAA